MTNFNTPCAVTAQLNEYLDRMEREDAYEEAVYDLERELERELSVKINNNLRIGTFESRNELAVMLDELGEELDQLVRINIQDEDFIEVFIFISTAPDHVDPVARKIASYVDFTPIAKKKIAEYEPEPPQSVWEDEL